MRAVGLKPLKVKRKRFGDVHLFVRQGFGESSVHEERRTATHRQRRIPDLIAVLLSEYELSGSPSWAWAWEAM